MNRRRLLAGVASAGIVGTAGCLDYVLSSTGGVRPESDPDSVPQPLHCDEEGFERVQPRYEQVHWGEVGRFSLRIDGHDFTYGETAQVTLKNTSPRRATSGVPGKHHIEVWTDGGWQDVRGGDPYVLSDKLVDRWPGQGFEWELELTESGLVDVGSDYHAETLSICPDLQAGRYRFVFYGAGGHGDGVAVGFDLRRES